MTRDAITERILEICKVLDESETITNNTELLLKELEELCRLSVQMKQKQKFFKPVT